MLFNVLKDLNVWQGIQCCVDTMHKGKRHDPELLTETVHEAWKSIPSLKFTTAFEMLNDVCDEALETEGECPEEGKGRGAGRRSHTIHIDLQKFIDRYASGLKRI